MGLILETVVFDGVQKKWRILNLNTGSVYASEFYEQVQAIDAIEHGQIRDGQKVQYVSLQLLVETMTPYLPVGDKEPKPWTFAEEAGWYRPVGIAEAHESIKEERRRQEELRHRLKPTDEPKSYEELPGLGRWRPR
jgi:hypothetical protein